ncbi:DUF3093 family protein [Microbacterium ulmi]|uniref:DUF3093 family protein n=1 Tax=Microbacterium ulmi TaxID=179095 RepID=A0A7Y2Q1D1_9MICO|nr:DUF3093 family protein [Microbacterium ulmi]NII71021.1 hypothetical protein [Microbacterium ulmi]NNH04212.1 DUF3093 family protein [Microbacterium ulmi]
MQKTAGFIRPRAGAAYRERLSPSLWALVSAAVVAPMAALVFAPLDTTVALVVGVLVGAAFVALLVAGSPVVEVRDGRLRAGRAHIGVEYLGAPVALTGDDARHRRGPGLGRDAWHVIRGGIDGVVVVPVTDPDDPTTEWVVSSRTPDRLAAALNRARANAETAG